MVTVYSLPNCVQCNATKRTLEKRGVDFEDIDFRTSEDGKLIASENGFTQAPVVVSGDEVWSGYRPDKLAELVA